MMKIRKTLSALILVSLANAAVLVCAEAGHSQSQNQSESAKVRLMKKLGGFFEKQDWPPYPMITKPQLILLGKIVDSTSYAVVEGHEKDQIPPIVELEYTVLTVQIIDQLKGKLSDKVIYLMKKNGWASLPFGDGPPFLHKGKYLLFLEPITEGRFKNFEEVIRKLKLPPKSVFQTYGGLEGGKGAVMLEFDPDLLKELEESHPELLKDPKFSVEGWRSRETSNRVLKTQPSHNFSKKSLD